MTTQQLLFPLPEPTGKWVSKRKAPDVQRIKVDHELAKQRYYLHRRLRKYFPYDADRRLVFVAPYQALEDIPAKPRKYIEDLIAIGYNIQIEIICPPPKIVPEGVKRKKTLTILDLK